VTAVEREHQEKLTLLQCQQRRQILPRGTRRDQGFAGSPGQPQQDGASFGQYASLISGQSVSLPQKIDAGFPGDGGAAARRLPLARRSLALRQSGVVHGSDP
jgi:hypothetical protein